MKKIMLFIVLAMFLMVGCGDFSEGAQKEETCTDYSTNTTADTLFFYELSVSGSQEEIDQLIKNFVFNYDFYLKRSDKNKIKGDPQGFCDWVINQMETQGDIEAICYTKPWESGSVSGIVGCFNFGGK